MDDTLRSWLCGLLVFGIIVLLVTDCCDGSNRYCPGHIRQHVYKQPYTSLSCTSDKHGTHCHTVYHPAQYRLLVECHKPDHVANINVGFTAYTLYRDDQPVIVGERIGRWSRIIWRDWIAQTDTTHY